MNLKQYLRQTWLMLLAQYNSCYPKGIDVISRRIFCQVQGHNYKVTMTTPSLIEFPQRYCLRATLLQEAKPVSYASKSLTPPKGNYEQMKKEAWV